MCQVLIVPFIHSNRQIWSPVPCSSLSNRLQASSHLAQEYLFIVVVFFSGLYVLWPNIFPLSLANVSSCSFSFVSSRGFLYAPLTPLLILSQILSEVLSKALRSGQLNAHMAISVLWIGYGLTFQIRKRLQRWHQGRRSSCVLESYMDPISPVLNTSRSFHSILQMFRDQTGNDSTNL